MSIKYNNNIIQVDGKTATNAAGCVIVLVVLGGLHKHTSEEFTFCFSSVDFKHKHLVCLFMIFVSCRASPDEQICVQYYPSLPCSHSPCACIHNLLCFARCIFRRLKKNKNVLLMIARKTNNALHIKLCRALSPWQSPKRHSYSDSSSVSTEGGIN